MNRAKRFGIDALGREAGGWRWPLLTAGGGLAFLVTASCGPTKPPVPSSAPSVATAPIVASATPRPPTSLDKLKKVSAAPVPAQWSLADNGEISTAADAPATPDFNPFALHPTGETGMHRVGLRTPGIETAKRYVVTVWIKANPGSNAMFELAATEGSKLTDYGVSYFDLSKTKVVPNDIVTPVTQMKGVKVAKDGDWIRISGPAAVAPKSVLSIVVGLVEKNEKGDRDTHAFAGKPDEFLTVGGITIADTAEAAPKPATAESDATTPAP